MHIFERRIDARAICMLKTCEALALIE